MKAYIVKKYVLVHDWAPHPVYYNTALNKRINDTLSLKNGTPTQDFFPLVNSSMYTILFLNLDTKLQRYFNYVECGYLEIWPMDMNYEHLPWKLPKDITQRHDPWKKPMDMTHWHDPRIWPMDITHGHDSWTWSMEMTHRHDPYTWKHGH